MAQNLTAHISSLESLLRRQLLYLKPWFIYIFTLLMKLSSYKIFESYFQILLFHISQHLLDTFW